MITIFKYQLQIRTITAIDMPKGANILTLQTQDGVPCFWAQVETDNDPIPCWFATYGTGHPMPQDFRGEYKGTYQLMNGALVYHVFEIPEPATRTGNERIGKSLMPTSKTPAPEPQTEATYEASLDDLDSKSRSILTSWMNKYVAKKQEMDDLAIELESIKLDHIEPLRLRLGLTKIDSDEWYIARRPGRPSLDKAKVKLYLVNKGVSVKLVTDAFDHATSTGKPYTEIKRKKEKE